MKKLLSYALFVLLIMTLVGVVIFQEKSRQQRRAAFDTRCQSLPEASFASQRSHAIILRGNKLMTVRLDGEKNFSPPGGHLEAGELPDSALRRELKEEIGIQVSSIDLQPFYTYCEVLGATKTQRTYTFDVRSWSGVPKVGQKDQLKWVDYEFKDDATADTELVKLLELLRAQKRI